MVKGNRSVEEMEELCKEHVQPLSDALYEKCQELGMAIIVKIGYHPEKTMVSRYLPPEWGCAECAGFMMASASSEEISEFVGNLVVQLDMSKAATEGIKARLGEKLREAAEKGALPTELIDAVGVPSREEIDAKKNENEG